MLCTNLSANLPSCRTKVHVALVVNGHRGIAPEKLYSDNYRTRNKGRSPGTDPPKLVSDRQNFIIGGHIDLPLFLTT